MDNATVVIVSKNAETTIMDASAKGALAILLSLADLFISVSFAHTSGSDADACVDSVKLHSTKPFVR